MKKFIIMLLFVFGMVLPFRNDFFVSYAAYEGGGAIIGSYDVDTWQNDPSISSVFLRFYDVDPSIDNNLSLSLLENKNAMVGISDLYFSFDYGEFYVTPFEYFSDYINSGYQYAPYSPIGSADMLRIQDTSLDLINKGDLVISYTSSQLKNLFPDFNYLYIIQFVSSLDYNTVYDLAYQDGFDDGQDVGYNDGYNLGFIEGETFGYGAGYDIGYDEGFYDGLDVGMIDGYNDGFSDGEDFGFNDGYQKAINDGSTEFGLTTLLSSLFVGLGSLLSIQLLPNISIGMIIAVPIVFGIIAFILGKRGGGD